MNIQSRVVLVTGAASGIGKATAIAFAQQGAAAVLCCDTNRDGLSDTAKQVEAAGSTARTFGVDVSDRHAMRELAAEVHRDHEALDVLVNNAGVSLVGGLLETSLEDWDWILSINVMGVIHCCHFFVPRIVERARGGHVVNVSSVAGFAAGQTTSAYCTSKFAVTGLSEALRDELLPHGIGVTTVYPGLVNTGMAHTARLRKDDSPEARARMIEQFEKRNYGPEKVASAIVDAVRSNRTDVPVSPEAWVMYYLKRMSPDLTAALGRKITAKMLSQPGPSPSR